MKSQSSRFTVLLSAACLLAASTVFAVNSTWVGGATGTWTDAANWSAGIPQTSNDTATLSVPATITIPASVTVKTLTVNAPATITVASGATLAFSNNGGDVLVANATCLVDGAGDLTFSMNGTTGTDYANIKPATGVTLTLAARVIASGASGVELNSAGTLLLTNPNNAFAGLVHISTANGTLSFYTPAALGMNAIYFGGSPSRCVYTGSGSATLALPVQIAAASAIFENAGAGTLTLSGAIAPASAGTKTLTFAGTTQTNLVTGGISNGSGVLNVVAGSGTLLLNGTVTGSTVTASGSATLAVGAGAVFLNNILSGSAGSTVCLNPSAVDGFAVTLPPTNILAGAGVRLVVPAAATTSIVTVPVLTRSTNATLDIAASNLGTARNTLLVQNLGAGPLPTWFTVNGQPAAYDAALGVIPVTASGSPYSLTALGPSTVPNDATAAAVIDAAGTSGGITLSADPTSVFSLTQNHAGDPATVDLGGQTLAATVITVASAGNSLTLTNGTLSTPTALTPPAGATPPSFLTNAIAWFDLADDTTVTTNAAGRISLLANKGSLGSALNVVVPSDRIGPRYVPGAVNGLGVARADDVLPPQGLATLNNAGLSGSAPRTAFIVASRSPVSLNSFYALYLGPDGGNNQDFCICERADRTSFSTKANDLDISPASPVGHNVLTFTTGLGDTNNAGAGYRNGLLLGTKTFALATVDAPIRLLHRPVTASANSGPGEVAEALVFNYTLSDADRAAVEAYLMHKWQIAAQRDDALLALRNDNPAAALAVPAALTEAYGTRLSLTKSGSGDVTLGGPVTFSGSLLISEGRLTFATPAAHTTVLAGIVSGSGALLKTGPGALALSQSSPYAGGTAVQAGTLYAGMNGSLGTGPVTLADGAALDIVNGPAATAIATPVSVAGAGPDGLGALRHSGGVAQQNALKTVTLTGDAAVYSASRFDARGGTFDFGGHRLTVNGTGEFSIVQSAISNVTASTGVYVASGMMRFEQSDFLGSSANLASAASGAGVCLYLMTAPMQWSLQLADNAFFRVNNGNTDTNLNRWAGPVTLAAGTARLNALAGGTGALTGAVGGDGGLLKEGPGWFWLFNPANTYAGDTAVTQGTLYAVSPGSLGAQAADGLAVSGTGTFVARAASGTSADGWSAAQLASIADASAFTTPATSLGLDTVYEDFVVSADLPYTGLQKFGPRKLTLTGAAPDLGALTVHNGELDLTGTGDHNLHGYSVTVGATSGASTASVLRVAGATLRTDDNGYNRVGPTLTVASAANTRGVLHVGAGAALNGRLVVGDAAGATGAVYQTGGSVTNTSGTANEAALGVSGYGYYRLDGGIFASKGATQFARNNGATALFEQRGGAFVINPGVAPADGVVGDYYNGSFSTRGGVGVFLLSGGTCNLNTHSLTLGDWVNVNNYNDGTGVLTLENDAQAEMAQIILANRNGAPQAFVNLNGGSLTTPYFQKGGNNAVSNNAVAAVNFNGGVLRVPAAGNAVSSLVRTSVNNTPALLNVYARGAVIETLGTDGGVSLDLPLCAPYGFGVSDVTLTAAGAGYLAPPVVLFTGGNGTGATAVAEINLGTGALTGIRVTSRGVGYTAAPTVTLRGGGFATAAAANVWRWTSSSGGLTKLGAGMLSLAATNTYTGPTVVSNGTLRLAAGGLTLTPSTPITVAGGTLDLGGATLTNFRPVVIESGRLVNGTVSALSFTKTGAGSATLTAQAVAPAPAALREAFIKSLGPIIWYDPSDTTPGNIILDGSSRVSLLRNKGTLGTTHDAIPYSGAGPLLLSGAASPSPLGAGVLQLDNATSAMKTAADVPITGTAPRTLVTLFARDTTRAMVGIGSGVDGQTFELGNDPTKTYVSGIGGGRDTQFTVNIPASNQLAFVAAVNGYNGNLARGIQLWRATNSTLETMTHTWPADLGTAAAPFSIGRRGATTYRGKVAEVLLFNRILTSNEVAALKDALVAKYLVAPAGGDVAVPPVTVAQGTLRLAPGADAIAALGPAVWYDPSDAASVTTNASERVTALANKGTRGSAMNAILQSGFQGPLLVADATTYSAAGRPMLKIDANSTGLRSASNTGISGAAPRTLIAVLSRDPTSPDPAASHAVLGFGRGTTRQLMELGDRSDGICYGLYGDDLTISPVLAAARANIYMMASTATNEATGWRSGGAANRFSKTLSGNWASAGDTPLHLGYRFETTARSNFRGQIGEVLLFDRLLTEAERADVEDYLVNKWTRPGADNPFSGVTFDVAAGATLDLGGARTNITVTGAGAITNGTLGAGFVISPAGDSAVGELALSGVTFTAGAQYRLTTAGNSSDRLLVDGDLSGLTVVPATGAQITGRSFVIATGAITGKPSLSGFPEKFLLRRQGNDLLLTTAGGTMILLK